MMLVVVAVIDYVVSGLQCKVPIVHVRSGHVEPSKKPT